MDSIFLVEYFTEQWSTQPKHKVCEGVTIDGTRLIGFAAEVGRFQVFLSVNIGKRGGISEDVVILDPAQRFVVDRLHLAERTVSGDGHFLELREMRNRVRRGGENPILVVRECVADCLSRIQAGKISESRVALMEARISDSLYSGTSAGAGSLGKRS